MKALVLDESGARLDVAHPEPEAQDEAIVRLVLGGVCATDLELVKGYMGFSGVLGHEWVGIVESAPERSLVGRRVVGDINCPCGICETCRAGRPTHCPHRTVLGILGRNGAFSERFTLPAANLHVVPEVVSDECAVFVEPLAAACEILEQIHVRPSMRIAVLGLGRLGLLCSAVLASCGADVTGIARRPERADLLGGSILAMTPDDALEVARFDVVVDATGSPDGIDLAARLVRPRGTIVLKTTVHESSPAPLTGFVIDEITVVGSRCGPFEPALRLLERRIVDPRPLISGVFPLDDGIAALAAAADARNVKVLITPQ